MTKHHPSDSPDVLRHSVESATQSGHARERRTPPRQGSYSVFKPAQKSPAGLLEWWRSTTKYQKDHEQDQSDHEEGPRDLRRNSCNAAETQNSCYQRDNKKDEGPIDHGILL